MTATALVSVRLNVPQVARSLQFYKSLGLVRDTPTSVPVRPVTVATAAAALAIRTMRRSSSPVLLHFPDQPSMQLELAEVPAMASHRRAWPLSFDHPGTVSHTYLVDRLRETLHDLRSAGATDITCGGGTAAAASNAVCRDPDGNLVELIQSEAIEELTVPTGGSVTGPTRSFFHFQLNTEQFAVMAGFYEALGLRRDPAYDALLDESAWNEVAEGLLQGLNFNHENVTDGGFWSIAGDPSGMNVELIGCEPGALSDPGLRPSYGQRGICRYSFVVDAAAMDEIEELVAPSIYCRKSDWTQPEREQESEQGRWIIFGDPDGNLLTVGAGEA